MLEVDDAQIVAELARPVRPLDRKGTAMSAHKVDTVIEGGEPTLPCSLSSSHATEAPGCGTSTIGRVWRSKVCSIPCRRNSAAARYAYRARWTAFSSPVGAEPTRHGDA